MAERNIYAIARQDSGMTQEAAAAELFVGVSSLRRYETGVCLPPDEVVLAMIDLYNAPWLALPHMRARCDTLPVIPEVKVQQLPVAVIQLYNRTVAFAEKHRTEQLMQIADDGIIDDQERPQFEEIADELNGIVAAALQVVYVRNKKETAGCGNIQRVASKYEGFADLKNSDEFNYQYSIVETKKQALERGKHGQGEHDPFGP